MSAKAHAAYGLGVTLGHASVQISRMDKDPVTLIEHAEVNFQRVQIAIHVLRIAQEYIQVLANQGITNIALGMLADPLSSLTSLSPSSLASVNFTDLNNSLGSIVVVFNQALHLNPPYGEVYDLGIQIGNAEHQASTSDPAAFPIARIFLDTALAIARHPKLKVVINPELLAHVHETDTNTITKVRETWEANFLHTTVI